MTDSAKFIGILFVYLLTILAVGCVIAFSQTEIPCGVTYKAKKKGELIKCVPESPAPSPIPTPVPTPTPTASPTPQPTSPPTMGKVVAKDGSGDYTSIQSAINAVSSGQTVWVKNGTYNEKVLINKSNITLKAYPGHYPKIVPGTTTGNRVEISASGSNSIVDGFEITGGYEGVKSYAPSGIYNNDIHDNNGQGILIVSASNVGIKGNTVYRNGISCAPSARHCHSIYLSNFTSTCKNMTNILIENNTLEYAPGAGVNVNASNCPGNYVQVTITSNIIKNNGAGFIFYRPGTSQSKATVIGNQFIEHTYPPTSDFSDSDRNAITIWGPTSFINSDVLEVNQFDLVSPYKMMTIKP